MVRPFFFVAQQGRDASERIGKRLSPQAMGAVIVVLHRFGGGCFQHGDPHLIK
jgi:hypothetical protein